MRETVTISLPQAVRRELDRIAKEDGISRSDVLRQSTRVLAAGESGLLVRPFSGFVIHRRRDKTACRYGELWTCP